MILWHAIVRAIATTVIATLALAVLPATADASPRSTSLAATDMAADPDGPGQLTYWYYDRSLNTDGRMNLPGGSGSTRSGRGIDLPPTWPNEYATTMSCQLACIAWGQTLLTSNTSTTLVVSTTTPVHWSLTVANEALGYSTTKAGDQSMTYWPQATFNGLEPGTTYLGTVRVEDAWGNTREASGYFTTLNW